MYRKQQTSNFLDSKGSFFQHFVGTEKVLFYLTAEFITGFSNTANF